MFCSTELSRLFYFAVFPFLAFESPFLKTSILRKFSFEKRTFSNKSSFCMSLCMKISFCITLITGSVHIRLWVITGSVQFQCWVITGSVHIQFWVITGSVQVYCWQFGLKEKPMLIAWIKIWIMRFWIQPESFLPSSYSMRCALRKPPLAQGNPAAHRLKPLEREQGVAPAQAPPGARNMNADTPTGTREGNKTTPHARRLCM